MNYAITGKGEGQKCLENYIGRQWLILHFCQPCVRTMLCSREGSMGEGGETNAHQHLPQPRHHVSEGVAAPELAFHTGGKCVKRRKGSSWLTVSSGLVALGLQQHRTSWWEHLAEQGCSAHGLFARALRAPKDAARCPAGGAAPGTKQGGGAGYP